MSLVKGDNVILYIYEDSEYKMYACARSCTLITTTEFIDVSVTGSGTWKSVRPTINSFTGTIEGLTSLEPDSMVSLEDLRWKQYNQQLLTIKYERTDLDGNKYIDECEAYISSITDTASFDNVSTFTVELQGTGAITQMS